MPPKTKQEIKDYVNSRKGDSVSLFKRKGKNYIAFKNDSGKFTGYIAKTRESVSAVKGLAQKVKIRVKIKGERAKKTIIYNVYNEQQRERLLFRMNSRLRDKKEYKREQKKLGFDSRNLKQDALPIPEGKNKVDLLFDKVKFKEVQIEKFEGKS